MTIASFTLLRLLGWLTGAKNAVMGVITRWPWQSAVVALILLNAWQWHEADRRASGIIINKWQTAAQLQARATGLLWNAIGKQNAAIARWQAQGIAQKAAAARALALAEPHRAQAEHDAAQMDRAASQPPSDGPACRTPEILMDRKDQL